MKEGLPKGEPSNGLSTPHEGRLAKKVGLPMAYLRPMKEGLPKGDPTQAYLRPMKACQKVNLPRAYLRPMKEGLPKGGLSNGLSTPREGRLAKR